MRARSARPFGFRLEEKQKKNLGNKHTKRNDERRTLFWYRRNLRVTVETRTLRLKHTQTRNDREVELAFCFYSVVVLLQAPLCFYFSKAKDFFFC